MSDIQGGRQLAAWLCAVLFFCFGLCYLIGFQEGLLQMSQRVWSDGQTEYMTLLSPVLITSLLIALATIVGRFMRPWPMLLAFSYMPSFLLLALLTSVSMPVPDGVSNGWQWKGFVAWLILTGVIVWIMGRIMPSRNYNRRISLSHIVLGNLSIMMVLISLTAFAANTRIHFHTALRMSALAAEERYDDLLKVAANTPECSRSICAMRAYALSQEGQLPEKLFSFPQHHGALGLIPPKADSIYAFNWPQAIYRSLGSYCVEDLNRPEDVIYYLRKTLERHPGQLQADYLLCAYLLEKRLDDFARELQRHYLIDENLPRHYKEALVIYQRRSQMPILQYCDEQTEANFHGFQTLRMKYPNSKEQEFHLIDMFHETYWCYYYYPSREDK